MSSILGRLMLQVKELKTSLINCEGKLEGNNTKNYVSLSELSAAQEKNGRLTEQLKETEERVRLLEGENTINKSWEEKAESLEKKLDSMRSERENTRLQIEDLHG